MRSANALLVDLLEYLEAGQMPPADAIAKARAAVNNTAKARAEMEAAKRSTMTDAEMSAALVAGQVHIRRPFSALQHPLFSIGAVPLLWGLFVLRGWWRCRRIAHAWFSRSKKGATT